MGNKFRTKRLILYDNNGYSLFHFFTQVRLYRKAHRALAVSEFFTTNQWRFLSSNPIRLLDEMSPQDRKIFCFDVRQIDWKNYFESYIIGVRRFILKENPKSIPIARVKLTR